MVCSTECGEVARVVTHQRLLMKLYALNFALVAAHEVDSAYWQEWRSFRLPGGIQFFTSLHIPLFLLFLWGFGQVWEGRSSARAWSLFLAVTGIACFVIHTSFLLAGSPGFRLPGSLALIGLILTVSIAQGAVALSPRPGRTSTSGSGGGAAA